MVRRISLILTKTSFTTDKIPLHMYEILWRAERKAFPFRKLGFHGFRLQFYSRSCIINGEGRIKCASDKTGCVSKDEKKKLKVFKIVRKNFHL